MGTEIYYLLFTKNPLTQPSSSLLPLSSTKQYIIYANFIFPTQVFTALIPAP